MRIGRKDCGRENYIRKSKESKSLSAIGVAERDNSQLFYLLEDAAPKVRRQLAQSLRSSPSFRKNARKDGLVRFIKSTRCKHQAWMTKWSRKSDTEKKRLMWCKRGVGVGGGLEYTDFVYVRTKYRCTWCRGLFQTADFLRNFN